MAKFKIPYHVVEPAIIDFFGVTSLKFKVPLIGNPAEENKKAWNKIFCYNGYRQRDEAILPVISPYFCDCLPNEDVKLESIDLAKREIVLRTKRKRCENMDFPKETWAVIIDTDLPVTDHFADNLCSYCTGLYGKNSADIWLNHFYKDMKIGGTFPGKNPFTKSSQPVQAEKYLTPCSPWPNSDWGSNGLYDFCNLATLRTMNGRLVHVLEVDHYFQWPAHMSVAIFFSKEIHSLQFGIIRARANLFCSFYPNAMQGKYHQVTDVRQELISSKSLTEPIRHCRQRVKVEIEEIESTL
jgi:hypothetical protein